MQLFESMLRRNKYSLTKARLSLFRALRAKHTLSIRELIAKLSKQDQASVYRNIKLFEELGIAHKLHLGWQSKLELSDLFQQHHHHLICIECSKVMDLLNDLPIEMSLARVANQQGFVPLSHHLEISGYCTDCAPEVV